MKNIKKKINKYKKNEFQTKLNNLLLPLFQIIVFSKKWSVKINKNYCIFTGRKKSVYRYIKCSRTLFREFVSNGFITGFKKSSW